MTSIATIPDQTLQERFRAVRAASERLAEPLHPEDCVVQSMPDASPTKWHLAHTSWFFETLVLKPTLSTYRPLDSAYNYLFNSYYNTIGKQFSRPHRGLVTRPTLAATLKYRRHVDRHMTALFERAAEGVIQLPETVITVGLHHEQQHQELIVTDLKHLLAQNPLYPVYRERSQAAASGGRPSERRPPVATSRPWPPGVRWIEHDGGVVEVGHADDGFAFDNETPRHRVFLYPFRLASRLVTCGEYLEFMADGGYRRPELWLSDGWFTVQQERWTAPLYWVEQDAAWQQFTLSGLRGVAAAEPVCHLSFYEADAYARWADARLPSEAEWEVIAADAPVEGNFAEDECFHPVPVPSDEAPAQLFGDVWEWTHSPYTAYPGYRPPAGALGEYNAKFMSGQYVLRGGSCATPVSHIRATYRNFFPPAARWQFSGIRLARDAD